MKLLLVVPALALTFIAASAAAQNQAPGLWESTITIKGGGADSEKSQADLQAKLAAMPPEQRKMVEDMMAKKGMTLGAPGQGNTIKTKVCITKEEAAKPAEARMSGDCKMSDVQRTSSSIKFKFACTQPVVSSGTGAWTFANDKAYSGTAEAVTERNGKTVPTKTEMSGTWLAADCGDVKPRAVAKSQ